jgi:hypothetical protein
MEHQTGLDGPDGTKDAGSAWAARPEAPEPEREAAPHAGLAARPEPEPTPREAAGPQREAAPHAGLAARPESEPEPGGATGPEPEVAPQPGTRPATGEPRVDAALKLLDRLPGLPVSEHPELFEQVHAQLSDVLGELDSGPAGPAGG